MVQGPLAGPLLTSAEPAPTADTATVVARRNSTNLTGATRYDLTVDTDHTYYVLAGTTPVLVHNCRTIDPATVRFSQRGVSSKFSDGKSIEETAAEPRSGKTSASDLPIMRLYERDGNLYTLDHRRLVAFQKAGLSEVPYRMATPEEVLAESFKMDPDAAETSINIRGEGVWPP